MTQKQYDLLEAEHRLEQEKHNSMLKGVAILIAAMILYSGVRTKQRTDERKHKFSAECAQVENSLKGQQDKVYEALIASPALGQAMQANLNELISDYKHACDGVEY